MILMRELMLIMPSKKSLLTNLIYLVYGVIFFMISGAVSCSAETSGSSEADVGGPSFDCKKASTKIEKAICGNDRLSELDYSLSRVYKKARENNVGVKSDQRKWLAKRNKCQGQEIASCLEMLYLQRINVLSLVADNQALISVPVGWKDFSHSKWVSVLGLSSRCSVNENIKHIRFVNLTTINSENNLLTVACELGAYQDSHLVFNLSINENSVMAKEIVVRELYFDNGWKHKVADKVTGYISLDNNEFVITRRYVGAWTCGYVAKYSLNDLLKGEVLYPLSAKADNDCDNGIRRDEWPVVDIID